MPEPPTRMATRPGNATSHPGLVGDRPKPRPRGEAAKVAAEKKAAKQDQRDAAVTRIASIEKRKAEEAMDDRTPRATTKTKGGSRQLRRTESFLEIPLTTEQVDSADDGMDVDQPSDSAGSRRKGGLTTTDDDNSSSAEDVLPPKKKIRGSKKDGIRSAIKQHNIEKDRQGERKPAGIHPSKRDSDSETMVSICKCLIQYQYLLVTRT